MSSSIVTVDMDDNLRTIKNIFDNAHFRHLLVVEKGVLFGVISDRDLLKSISPEIGTISETAKDIASLNKKAHQIMSRKPVTMTADASIDDAIDIFNKQRISCIPVVDDENHPMGILSWRDILKVVGGKAKN